MLKKVLIVIGTVLLVFILLIYGSLWSKPENPEVSIILNKQELDSINLNNIQTVQIAASTQYEGTMLKHLMQGEHYRKAWEAPVTAKVIFMDRYLGGMKFLKKGGGKQTNSLKIEAKNGIVYTLRSVNKDPKALVPEYAKALGFENLIIDGISAQHPYGALPAAALSEKAGILHTHPQLVFLPKQNWLNDLNETYGNKLYLLEYESEGKINWTSLQNITEILDTKDLIELKHELGDNVSIDEAALVRVRLLDLLIGDWDRHAKQWGWAMQKRGDNLVGIPIAGDRDNAFFTLDGILPTLLSNKSIEPKLRPFKKDIDYLPGLLYDFDTYFLKDIPQEVFIAEALFLQEILTDDAIEDALKVWPESIYDLDGEEIEDKLRSRRDHLKDYALKFYEEVRRRPLLDKPLFGLEKIEIPSEMFGCFRCNP